MVQAFHWKKSFIALSLGRIFAPILDCPHALDTLGNFGCTIEPNGGSERHIEGPSPESSGRKHVRSAWRFHQHSPMRRLHQQEHR